MNAKRSARREARRTRTTCQCTTLQCAQHCAQSARGVHCKHGTMLCAQSCQLSSSTALCPRSISLPLLRTRVPAWSRVGSLVWPCSWVGLFSTSVRLVELRASCLQVLTVGTCAFLDGRRLHDAGPFLLSLLLSPLVCR